VFSLTFFTSGFTAQVIEGEIIGIKRRAFNRSSMRDLAECFLPDKISDAGVFKFLIAFNPDQIPPLDSDIELVELSFESVTIWRGMMYLQAFQYQSPLDEKMRATVELKVSGAITVQSMTPIINDDSVFVQNDDGNYVYGA
jgi:hypothetical protein